MRKTYCDWCGAEIIGPMLSGGHSRRIALTSDIDEHKLSVVVKLEFHTDDVPQDLCGVCVSSLLKRATEVLMGESVPR